MAKTYTTTRQNYYIINADEIKRKRRERYQKNIVQERLEALDRHFKNKKRNNATSLANYHKNSDELNKKRTLRRRKII